MLEIGLLLFQVSSIEVVQWWYGLRPAHLCITALEIFVDYHNQNQNDDENFYGITRIW